MFVNLNCDFYLYIFKRREVQKRKVKKKQVKKIKKLHTTPNLTLVRSCVCFSIVCLPLNKALHHWT